MHAEYSTVAMNRYPVIAGVMFCVVGIGGLLTALFKRQPWFVRYIQVAIGLTFLVLGILIALAGDR